MQKIQAEKISDIPTAGLKDYIADLARQHGVSYIKTSTDVFAETITRLADDDITTDDTEDLLVALKRAHVIDAETMVALLGNYLEEKRIASRCDAA